MIIFIIYFSLINQVVYSQDKYREALQLLKNDPTNSKYLSLAGDYYLKNGQKDLAISNYEKALKYEPDNSYNYIKLADAYLKFDRPDIALNIYSNAYYYFENNIRIISGYANASYKVGNFDLSIKLYEKALSKEPKNVMYLSGIAKAYRESKEYKKSEDYFKTALKIKEDFWILYEIGLLYLAMNDYDKALSFFNKAKQYARNEKDYIQNMLYDKIALIYFNSGMKAKDNNDKENAKKYFKQILDDKNLEKTKYGEKASFWIKKL